VEGLTKSKSEIMAEIFQGADILTIQETHIPEGGTKRLSIPGFRSMDYKGHNKHGIVTYVNQQIDQQIIKKLKGN
jgi:exonuclease III